MHHDLSGGPIPNGLVLLLLVDPLLDIERRMQRSQEILYFRATNERRAVDERLPLRVGVLNGAMEQRTNCISIQRLVIVMVGESSGNMLCTVTCSASDHESQ